MFPVELTDILPAEPTVISEWEIIERTSCDVMEYVCALTEYAPNDLAVKAPTVMSQLPLITEVVLPVTSIPTLPLLVTV